VRLRALHFLHSPGAPLSRGMVLNRLDSHDYSRDVLDVSTGTENDGKSMTIGEFLEQISRPKQARRKKA
jgi:hypothetical protein